ncbi:MAG: hypothetical protein JWN20_2268, partial [Jatrophihabitantaceae bacterium]|nr:hypothetical protein [Jatrophihabitantaceae bacterium]
MSPRASLPGAAELFRSTGTSGRVPTETPSVVAAESPDLIQSDPAPALSAVRDPAPDEAAFVAAPR